MKTSEIIRRLRAVKMNLVRNGCSVQEAERYILNRSKIHTLKLKTLEREAKRYRCK